MATTKPPQQSFTLATLPATVPRPAQEWACETCPNALWHVYEKEEGKPRLSPFCRIMFAVIDYPILKCDGNQPQPPA